MNGQCVFVGTFFDAQQLMQRLREKIAALPPNTRTPVDPYASGLTNVTLRDYQLAGLAWLHGCHK